MSKSTQRRILPRFGSNAFDVDFIINNFLVYTSLFIEKQR